ncbi:MAG: serine/threonine protein kinase [Deltaproteobacteria bacterium]|nr:serine/threonine protein kinase [Deltaproteobacteria bacterium]
MEDELVGRLLGGRYRVTRRLSEGGMGVVYEATQEDLGRRVALKVMHPGFAQSRTAIERFRREAISAAALSHPHIVQVTDLAQDADGTAFLVMELLSGDSLEQAIQVSGPMSVERVLFITGQVLDALGAAHRAGIVHRDLKPANIFLTQLAGVADVVKLLDFGTAKLRETDEFARLTRTGQLVGTPLFMAPEQARGDAVDGRADIYSLGLVMQVALTARAPFPTHDQAALLMAIQESAPEPLSVGRPGLPPDLVALVEQATAKDPASRFQTVDAMRAALSAIGGSRMKAEHAAQTSIHAQAPRRVRRPRARSANLGLWLALGALALLIVSGSVAAAVYFVMRRTSEPELATESPGAPAASPSSAPTPTAAPAIPSTPRADSDPQLGSSKTRTDLPQGRIVPIPAAQAPASHHSRRVPRACVAGIRLSPGPTYGLYSPDKLASALGPVNSRAARCAARLPPGVASLPALKFSVTTDGVVGNVRFEGVLPSGTGRAGSCLRRSLSRLALRPTENGLAGNVSVRVDLTPCTPPPWDSGG